MHREQYLGINVSLNHIKPKDMNILIEKILNLGCGWVRLEFDWYGKTNYDLHDQFINTMYKNKINILGLITGIVHGTMRDMFFPKKNIKPVKKNLNEFIKFVEIICKRYSNKIKTWEIWNEENTRRFWLSKPNPEEYVVILDLAIKTILNIDTKAKIISGGIMGNGVDKSIFFKEGFITAIEKKSCKNNIYAYAFHPYNVSCYISFFKKKEDYLKEIKKDINIINTHFKNTNKNIWITEYGISGKHTRAITDSDIGWIYCEALKYSKKKNMILFLWTIVDIDLKRYNSLNPERYFGLLDKNMQEKDSYIKLKNYLKNS